MDYGGICFNMFQLNTSIQHIQLYLSRDFQPSYPKRGWQNSPPMWCARSIPLLRRIPKAPWKIQSVKSKWKVWWTWFFSFEHVLEKKSRLNQIKLKLKLRCNPALQKVLGRLHMANHPNSRVPQWVGQLPQSVGGLIVSGMVSLVCRQGQPRQETIWAPTCSGYVFCKNL